ncbi:FtsX-like permease family protein [Rossellomorea aquimaris]|jgi:bacitracin transport system permease protein|uniref:ABC transporter permease n=1 Tax=Rossellomorea aquimaris TaxID=189382 RepID=A0A5D4TNT5_9BACI|nr:ABC transporter permease [Rossellomorea aquimaris]TYS76152.1 ABC transporter permease [Rossellomorea aquimaris]TYS82587.1 ABC transporter permease [Rossellomorea aquimaris]
MNINTLIFRNLKKNLKNYYLYVFALVFSVALYFAFVTLQYDPSMDATKGSIKGGAAVRAASVLLVAIVSIFLLYANTLFIKRRSKEIGLFQLIGMTKNKIFRILTVENFILYFGSLILGILIGFSFSKLIIMILFKITGVEAIATLHFSTHALIQTILVFCAIYLLIMLMNFVFIKRQSILSLFRVRSSTETKVKKMSKFEIIIGILGMTLVASGYYVSSKLFGGDFTTMPQLFGAMLVILGSVILGTYLFYKGSVSFIFNVIRKRKDGYLNINEVLSLSSIMFRMKSNALLLTIITTVSALAIALLSLSYIGYYSAEKTAQNNVPTDFSFTNTQDFQHFKDALLDNGIEFKKEEIEVIEVLVNLKGITDSEFGELNGSLDAMPNSVISEKDVEGVDVKEDETVFTGYSDLLQKVIPLHDSGVTELKGKTEVTKLNYLGMRDEYPISWYFTAGGSPVVIVDDNVFKRLKNDLDPAIQKESSLYIGVTIEQEKDILKANDLFHELSLDEGWANDSQYDMKAEQKQNIGLIMFIVGFLGLTFLITSGCILYFKQMDESEDEKPNYTILRKLGFTQGDLLKGIQAKQLFSFGIPLLIGLLHSYFAVQSGWFLFGAEVWTPMIIVMGLYTILYSIFGVLSVLYYKKVIKSSL